MKLARPQPTRVQERLTGQGLILATPPFTFKIRASSPEVRNGLLAAYAEYEVLEDPAWVDFEIHLYPAPGIRRWLHPLIALSIDGQTPFDPLPATQAFPLLEWAMNWCVTSTAHQFIMCHSAVLAKGDNAAILPAPPGSGKSTLCAALSLSGWRLLSDELALIETDSLNVVPFARPVSLKNGAIDVIANRFDQAVLTPRVHDTIKGTVSHMRAPRDMADPSHPARPRWVVLPHYSDGCEFSFVQISKAEGVAELARNSFNFSAIGQVGFESFAKLADQVDFYHLNYSRLDDALEFFDTLAAGCPA